MKTIKNKLFLLFFVFTISFIFCGILLNALFLENYYIYKSKSFFIDAYKKVKNSYKNSDKKKLLDIIRNIDRGDGISVTIANENSEIIFCSYQQSSNNEKIPSEIDELIKKNKKLRKDSYIYTIVNRPDFSEREIVYLAFLNTKDVILLKKPIKGINESVLIADQFYLLAGIIMIIVGGIIIYLFSKKITKPIVEMSNIAEDIANLNFNARINYSSKDEIGILANSINKISDKLSTSIENLVEDVERRKQLVRNISHELKTPIGVIKGYSEGLKYGVVEDVEKKNKYCTVIAEECDRMDSMVRELLNLSMLESGSFNLNICSIDIEDMFKKIEERFLPIFTNKNIVFKFECEKDLVILADKELIERIINNFITNALNHIDNMKVIKLNSFKVNEYIKFTVFNSGEHISNNEISSIWDVFYKVDKARSRQYGGHGLGLSIVKLIAELHKGRAGIENVDGGVLFYVEIPGC